MNRSIGNGYRRIAFACGGFALAVAAAFWMAGDGLPTKEQFSEAGFSVRQIEPPPWLSHTEWLKKLTRRSQKIVWLSRRSIEEPLSEKQFEFLLKIPPVERLSLPQSGLTDDQLRSLIRRHHTVVQLDLDRNLLTDDVIPDVAKLPNLLSLSIDCEQVSLATLSTYADRLDLPDFVTPTAGARLAARFLEPADDDVSGFPGMFAEYPWTHLYKGAISRGLPDNAFELEIALEQESSIGPLEKRSARFFPRHRRANVGNLIGGVVGIDVDSTDRAYRSFRRLTEREFEALAAIRRVWLLEMTGVDPVKALPATLQVESFGASVRTPAIARWLFQQKNLEYQRYWDVVGTEQSFSEIDLTGHLGFKFDADRFPGNYITHSRRTAFSESTPAYVHPITGSFLSSVTGGDAVTELVIRGRLPVGDDLQPVFVDFGQFQSLTKVTLVQLAIDDASLKTLAELPKLKDVSLGDLPHVTAVGLTAIRQRLGDVEPALGERLRSLLR